MTASRGARCWTCSRTSSTSRWWSSKTMAGVRDDIGISKPCVRYGRDRSLESGQAERVRRRHLRFFFDLAQRAEPELMGLRQASWLKQLHLEHDNLRSALGLVYVASSIGGAARQGLGLRDGAVVVLGEAGAFCRGTPVARSGGGDGSQSSSSRRSQGMRALANTDVLPGRFRRYGHLCDEQCRARPRSGKICSASRSPLVSRTIAAAEAGDVGLALRLAGDCRSGCDRKRKPVDRRPGSLRAGISGYPRG